MDEQSEQRLDSMRERPHPFTVPSFFPRPANPGASSTPAQTPGFPSMGPKNRSVPSMPRLSMRTASPWSNVRSLALFLLSRRAWTSDWRLSGREDAADVDARGVYENPPARAPEDGVLGSGTRGGPVDPDEDAAEGERTVAIFGGRPADLLGGTGRPPDWDDGEECGERGLEWSLGLPGGAVTVIRCCLGSFARIASVKARDIVGLSSDGVAAVATVEPARERPGVGMPEPAGLPGVGMRPRVEAAGPGVYAMRLMDQR